MLVKQAVSEDGLATGEAKQGSAKKATVLLMTEVCVS
jgi:hypothetical protein